MPLYLPQFSRSTETYSGQLMDLWPVPQGQSVSLDQTLVIPYQEPELQSSSPLFIVSHSHREKSLEENDA